MYRLVTREDVDGRDVFRCIECEGEVELPYAYGVRDFPTLLARALATTHRKCMIARSDRHWGDALDAFRDGLDR